MKRSVLFVLIVCLCLNVFGSAALAEAVRAETAAAKSAEELYQAGRDAYDAKDYEKAMEYFQAAADQDYTKALSSIGSLYAEGQGVEQDYGKAREYWLLAADKGVAQALCELVNLY